MLESWEVQQLVLKGVSELMSQAIMGKLIQVRLGSLQHLFLRDNCIYTLESLHRASMPSLQELLIGKNRLVSVRDFRKLHCPHLINFDMESNYISDCQKLTELLTEDKMSELDLEWYAECPEMSPDARWILKLKAKKLINLCNDVAMK